MKMEATETSTPVRATGKLETLSKEELVKFIKKQAVASKELKKKVEDLNTSLQDEREQVGRLESEKKEWISRGVTAEFEKKDRIVKKEKELELAALLGKEMLAENDDLQVEIDEMKREHDETIQDFEDELDKVLQEKEYLESTLEAIQEDYKSAKQEAEECRTTLQAATEMQEKDSNVLLKENKDFRERLKELEHQLNTSTVNLKYHKLKERYDELVKENKFNKEAKITAEEESKTKSEHMVDLDKDMKTLRKDIAEHQRQKRADLLEIDSLRESNAELTSSLHNSLDKIKELESYVDMVVSERNENSFYTKELDNEVQKVKSDKEKLTKTLRNMKTKLERATQMEEELKKQLNIIVCERDDLSKRLQKKNQQKAKGKTKSPKEEELEKEILSKVELVKELENQLSVLESENSELQNSANNFRESNGEILERYENLKKDFESLSFEIDELTTWKTTQVEEKQIRNAENEKLKQKCKKLEDDFIAIQSEKDSLTTQYSVLETDLKSTKEKLKKTIDHSSQEKERLQVKIRQLDDEKKKWTKSKSKRAMKRETSSPSKTLKNPEKSTQHTVKEDEEDTKATILKLEARVDELLNQLQRLNEEKHNQETELEELFKSHDDLQNKYDFECQERERKENEVHSLEEKLATLESSDGVEKSAVDLNLQIRHLEESVTDLRGKGEHYKKEVEVKEQCIVHLRNEIEELRQKQTDANTANNKEVDNIYQEFEHLDRELSATKNDLKLALNEKESLNTTICNLENEKKKIVETLSITSQKLLEMKRSFDQKIDEVAELKRAIENMNERQNESQGDTSNDLQNEILKSEIKELNKKLSSYENTIKENDKLRDEVKSLQTDLKHFDNEYKKTSTDNLHLKESFERMISLKTELQAKLSELNTKFQMNEKESLCKKEILDKLKSKVHCDDILKIEDFVDSLLLKATNSCDKVEYENLKEELDVVKAEKDQLVLCLSDTKEDVEKQNASSKEKEVMLEQMQNEFMTLRSEFDTLNKEKTEFEQNITSTQNLLSEKNIVIQKLRTHMKELEQNMEKPILMESEIQTLREEIKYKDILISDLSSEVNKLSASQETVSLHDKNIASVPTQTEELHLDKITEKDSCISTLKVEVENLQQIIENLQVDSVNFKMSEENYSNEIHEKQCAIDKLNKDVELLQSSLNEAMQKLNETNVLVEQMKCEMLEKDTSHSDVSESLNKAQAAVVDLQVSLSEKDETINKHAKELNESKSKTQEEILELSENLALMEAENKALTDELNRKEAQCEHFKILVEEKVQLVQSLKDSFNQENDKGKVIAEFEQFKINYQKLEEELQSALNKIDELENTLKERQEKTDQLESLREKGNKFKTVAIRAKKELESLRTQYEVEKRTLEEQVKLLLEEGKTMKTDLVRQKTECGKHEEEFEEMQTEIKSLQEKISMEKENCLKISQAKDVLNTKLEEMVVSLSTCENKISTFTLQMAQNELEQGKLETIITETEEKLKKCEDSLKLKNEEYEKLKTESETLQKNLGHAEKETQQMNVMNLEIHDYLRTIENLQVKTQEKDKMLKDSQEIIEKLKNQTENLQSEIDSLKKSKAGAEDRNKRFKGMIVKLKKEVVDSKEIQEVKVKERGELDTIIEALKQNGDEMKLEISSLLKDKLTLTEQIKTAIDSHEKMYQALEVKFARVNSDLVSSQRLYKELQEEYENYKVRAHNVLKQQKSLKVDSEKEIDNIERARLEDMTEQLKSKLQETAQKLNILQSDHGELEIEHERLQTRHKQFVEEITEKETGWKQRFEQFKIDKTTKILEYEDKVKLLTKENDALLRSAKESSEMMKADEKNYIKQISSLKEDIKRLEDQTKSHSPLKKLDIQKQESVESKSDGHMSLSFKSVLERQEGEGMDQKELELIDTLSQRSPSSVPHTPLSPTSSTVLERILSPSESQYLSSPQTPGSMREELFTLRSSLSTSMKKNEHLTALLRDCEANASRLDEQAKVLKEEIRRLERNAQREQALSNLEYLKNVIIKFLKVGAVERQQLIPVICTMLKLSSDEKLFITEFAKGDEADTTDEQSWSSYVYRWTSLS